jgi:broad specificity phosphatase PhoE
MLLLVRHAIPERIRGVPAEDWHLGDEGRAAARALAGRLDRDLRLVASDEPKAVETAEELIAVRGGTLAIDARLREVARPPLWDGGYRERAQAYVGGEPVDGWEPHEQVIARFAAAAADAEAVVAHGLAMSLYLPVADRVAFWQDLRFPDAWRLSALARQLRRVD